MSNLKHIHFFKCSSERAGNRNGSTELSKYANNMPPVKES